MREPYRKGLATHPDPESCGVAREGGAEALTGARAGRAMEPRNHPFGVPTLYLVTEGNTAAGASASPARAPRGRGNLRMLGNSMHGNREIS